MKATALLLLHPLRSLILGFAVLCLLVQPILNAAHELHEIEHSLAVETGKDLAVADTSAKPDGGLDGVLHGLEGCLHGTPLTTISYHWTPRMLRGAPPISEPAAIAPSPLSRFLRPPITA